jgi:hypothetical protein
MSITTVITVVADGTGFAVSFREEGGNMSKEVISVQGEERVVREDTAKAYRGINWALLSVAAFVLIAAFLMFTGALSGLFSSGQQPATNTQTERHTGP